MSMSSPRYWAVMIRRPPSVRRCVAAFAAVIVLFAPITEVAHARAMAHAAMDCSAPAASHHHAPAPPRHQHAGTCCDFCAIGCTTTIALPAGLPAIAAALAEDADAAGVAGRSVHIALQPHLLPFSQAPPHLSA